MKRVLVLVILLVSLCAVPAYAQGNYAPMDLGTLPQAPGCAWYPNANWPGIYDAWCGSDEIGWYQPYEWYKLTGYAMGGG